MWIHVRNSSLSRFHERFHFKTNCCEFLVFAATIRNSATDVARFNQRPTAWQLTASSTTFKFRASYSGPDVINVMGIIFLNIPVLQLPLPFDGSRSGDIYETRIQISCQVGGITRWWNENFIRTPRSIVVFRLGLRGSFPLFFLFRFEKSIINFLVKKKREYIIVKINFITRIGPFILKVA